jgi:hypothetical protein
VVSCAHPNINVQQPNFNVKGVKLHCACTCVSEFTVLRCISETWGSLHHGKETTLRNINA